MKTHGRKSPVKANRAVAGSMKKGASAGKFNTLSTPALVDNRPEVASRATLREITANAPQFKGISQLQEISDHNNSHRPTLPTLPQNKSNLPDNIKAGIENLSGYTLNEVHVHYNSDKPGQLKAHAYARGNDIFLGPGQEKHLPHEAWHVVQQHQGRVRPTAKTESGTSINDDQALEREADIMGARAIQLRPNKPARPMQKDETLTGQCLENMDCPAQLKVGFEFQAYNSVTYRDDIAANNGQESAMAANPIGQGAGFKVEHDSGASANEMEIVTDAVEENVPGRAALVAQMAQIHALTNAIAHDARVNTLAAGGVHWVPSMANFYFHINGHVHFHPQSTVGVKFNKIADLIDLLAAAPYSTGGLKPDGTPLPAAPAAAGPALAHQIGWSGQQDQQAFKTAWATGLGKARADLHGASDNAISFASILYGFAEVTTQNVVPGDSSYAKYFMPFLLRLGLLPHYGTLSAGDLVSLGNISPAVLNAQVIPVQAEFATEDGTMPTIQHLLNALGAGRDLQNLSPYWDILGYGASDYNTDLGMATNTDIGVSTAEPAIRAGAVIELRKLGNDVTPLQLPAFALAVFDLIQLINTPPPVAAAPPAAAAAAPPPDGNGRGCCFLTTACCDFMKLDDDCDELYTLRLFLDDYLMELPDGNAIVSRYYEIAPVIVERINLHQNRNSILNRLFAIISLCVTAIKSGKYETALLMYSNMTVVLLQGLYPEYTGKTPAGKTLY